MLSKNTFLMGKGAQIRIQTGTHTQIGIHIQTGTHIGDQSKS
jgi:hypothetical protein